MTPALDAVDHLLLGVPDLDAGIAWVEERTGARAAVGGSHPGRGTRNALLALTKRQYLEIIAPDPAQLPQVRSGLADLESRALVKWAAVSTYIAGFGVRLRAAGMEASGPRPGARNRPDGRRLEWTTLALPSTFAMGEIDPLPFFIQWSPATTHPSLDSPPGCELLALEFEHTDAEALRQRFSRIGIDAIVRDAERVRLIATVKTPRGMLTL
jgi:hypothetical protein